MSDDTQEKVFALLSSPLTHGSGVGARSGAQVKRVDTHGAVLFLTRDYAYKVKRAVRLPYLDYSTLDLRKNPLVAPRGFVFDNTVDLAIGAVGSDLDFIRATARASYYLSFAPEPVTLFDEDLEKSPLEHWFERSLLAFGARSGIVYPLKTRATSAALAIPIDERFFSGGSATVRSFGERDLGPHDRSGNPIGGEFFTIFNVEYTFPLYEEFLGAVFIDAGNLLPDARSPGLNDLRYAIGAGLRYNLPIGPVRLDYGVNPSPRDGEAFGAFHFSFGFAF